MDILQVCWIQYLFQNLAPHLFPIFPSKLLLFLAYLFHILLPNILPKSHLCSHFWPFFTHVPHQCLPRPLHVEWMNKLSRSISDSVLASNCWSIPSSKVSGSREYEVEIIKSNGKEENSGMKTGPEQAQHQSSLTQGSRSGTGIICVVSHFIEKWTYALSLVGVWSGTSEIHV